MNYTGLICRYIKEDSHITQRELAVKMKVSLGTVNKLMREVVRQGLITQLSTVAGTYELTGAGDAFLEGFRVDGALIIAAGFGSRFVPLTFEMPKGLLEVFGERMIERQICQLHQVGITDITIAVGYMKEKFEYLIDKYQVTLLYNPEYTSKNTLATIYRAQEILRGRNMYVLSSDNWMRENMFHAWECDAWYAGVYMSGSTSEWVLSYNKKERITHVRIGGHDSWVMYGPVFFSRSFSNAFLPMLEHYYHTPGTEQLYWEHVLMENIEKLELYINRQPENQIYEFENLEELRLFDPRYQTRSDNKALQLISQVFDIPEASIYDIQCLKSGMTNKSFLFRIENQHYICRIPGPGTELLINRHEESAVYDAIRPLDLSERIIYFNENTGYKIAEYYRDARKSRPDNQEDMAKCMHILRRLHESGVTVKHSFDIREKISFYEGLCTAHGGTLFEDYPMVRSWMNELMDHLEQLNRPATLAHIDSVSDNFLFLPNGSVRLIDWEYAGMCDPLIDVGMCSIYSYYNEQAVDILMEQYFQRIPEPEERLVIYSYIALGGFLWSLWGIYKASLGEEFGEYTLIMYRYAKDYYRKICTLTNKNKKKK